MSDHPGTPETPLSVPDAIAARRSTRSFRPDPIPADVLRRLIELTVSAPSSWNFQPWRIVVVRDAERKERLCKACWGQAQVREAPAVFVFAHSHAGWRDTMDDVIEQAASSGAWADAFVEVVRTHAPTFQEQLGAQLREYNTKDALIAATHLALAAQSLGLNSTFMNGYLEEPVKELIGAGGNDDIGVALVMPIGYAAKPGQDPGRLPLERNVFAEDLDHPLDRLTATIQVRGTHGASCGGTIHPRTMNTVPFLGRLDVTLACLMVVERHGTLVEGTPSFDEIWQDVLAVVDHLDLPAECLEDLDHFESAVEDSLDRLVDAGWISGGAEVDEERYGAVEMSTAALEWIRTRLSRDPLPLRAFEDLHADLTSRVLEDCGESDISTSFVTSEISADA